MNTNWTIEEARKHINPTSDIFARFLLSSPENVKFTKSFINAVLDDAGKQEIDNVKKGEKLHHYSLVVHEDCHDELFYPNGDPEKFHIIELDRFDFNENALYNTGNGAHRKMNTKLFHWLRFFQDGARSDFMEKYAETDTTIAEAKENYEQFIADEQKRDAEFRHELFLHDQAQAKHDAEVAGLAQGIKQGLSQGLSQGIKQGIAQGIKQKAHETAYNMKAHNIPSSVIAECTGLSVEEIEAIK
jgi:predicted transposase/invertase (TIGR01784 family)